MNAISYWIIGVCAVVYVTSVWHLRAAMLNDPNVNGLNTRAGVMMYVSAALGTTPFIAPLLDVTKNTSALMLITSIAAMGLSVAWLTYGVWYMLNFERTHMRKDDPNA